MKVVGLGVNLKSNEFNISFSKESHAEIPSLGRFILQVTQASAFK